MSSHPIDRTSPSYKLVALEVSAAMLAQAALELTTARSTEDRKLAVRRVQLAVLDVHKRTSPETWKGIGPDVEHDYRDRGDAGAFCSRCGRECVGTDFGEDAFCPGKKPPRARGRRDQRLGLEEPGRDATVADGLPGRDS